MYKAIPVGFFLLAVGVATGGWSAVAPAAEAQPGADSKWEYRVVTKEQLLELGKNDLVAGLNKLGEEGWELAAVDAAYIFKRDKVRHGKTVEDARRRLLVAESEVERWKERIAWSERMVKKGYLTERHLLAETAEMKLAEIALEKARQELKSFQPEPKPVRDNETKPQK